MLRIHLLGKLELTRDGDPVTASVAAKPKALMCYLAMTRRAVSRETLAGLLWGEAPQGVAQTSLRQALTQLRKLGLEPWLVIGRDSVAFNLDAPSFIDAIEFERFAQPASASPASLDEAVALYRGDFLEGLSLKDAPEFDEWLLTERERYREIALAALQTLADRAVARGDYAASVGYARRILALDAWREEAHRLLMLCYARSGQRSAALAQFEKCREVLRRELGVEPSAETQRLHERIRLAGESARAALPPDLTPFVGRAGELDQLNRLVVTRATRLISLLGPGGVGKSRLALAFARANETAFINGAGWVDVVEASTADQLVSDIAAEVGCVLSGRDSQAQLVNFLRERELLLVLDGFDSAQHAATLLSVLLRECLNLVMLVTTRERLNLRGEQVFGVDALSLPDEDDLAGVAGNDGARLFFSQAQRLDGGYRPTPDEMRSVARICRLVKGIPLGIELAAAWTHAMSSADIADEIERSLDFLAAAQHDAPDRQRSLRAVFESSWARLSQREREVFARLCVFHDGCDRDAAQAVAGASAQTLASLADKSFIKRAREELADERYVVHDIMREFAAESLGDALTELRCKHAEYFARRLALRAGDFGSARQRDAMRALHADLDNVRTAWAWLAQRGDTDGLTRALDGWYEFMYARGNWHELAESLDVAERNVGAREKALRARLQARAACLRVLLDAGTDTHAVRRRLTESLAALEAAGDSDRLVRMLNAASAALVFHGDADAAQQLAERSLALNRGRDKWNECVSLQLLGMVSYVRGDYTASETRTVRGLALGREVGHLKVVAECLDTLGTLELYARGRYAEAVERHTEACRAFDELGDFYGLATARYNLGVALYLAQRHDDARAELGHSLSEYRAMAQPQGIGISLTALGMVDYATGDHAHGERLCREALEIYRATDEKYGVIYCLATLGDLVGADSARAREAEALYREGARAALDTQNLPGALFNLAGLAELYSRGDAKHNAWARDIAATVSAHAATIQVSRERMARLKKRMKWTADGRRAMPLEKIAAKFVG